jgi:folate-binding protein YgfZ
VADRVLVAGPDAAAYLQGQLSQDVETMTLDENRWSFVLDPTGHIDAFVQVVRVGDQQFALDVEAGFGERLLTRLKRFLLRTKADVTLEPGGGTPFAVDERARIEAGIPSMATDIDDRTVPAETGWVGHAVSFTKGCYTGQELVARMDSRVAEPPRRLVHIEGDATVGAALVVEDQEVGVVTSAADGVALGYVKRGTPTEGAAAAGGLPVVLRGPVGA